MPEICRFYGIIIYMYFADHNPPHFHAIYGEYEAVISIAEGKIIAGNLPNRAEELVLAWYKLHQAELLNNWILTSHKSQPTKINPLI